MNDAISLIRSYCLNLQKNICQTLEQEETGLVFVRDEWQRSQGGGGITQVLENGKVWEKVGVNFSHVFGDEFPKVASPERAHLSQCPFQALGVSVVIHPRNPYVPTSHMNVRFFSATLPDGSSVWWFGGGFDLTPYYGFEEDCVHWHRTAKKACAPLGEHAYAHYKKWADDYFFLKHRNEPRGIGGLFFDDLSAEGFEKCFAFMQSIAEHFLLAYMPIVKRRIDLPYGERELKFQHYRRGRYVEFNLLYDRGTFFGLQSSGRVESILISLPPEVSWHYNFVPEKNSKEAELTEFFLKKKEWI